MTGSLRAPVYLNAVLADLLLTARPKSRPHLRKTKNYL
jgi:hypothetical protein